MPWSRPTTRRLAAATLTVTVGLGALAGCGTDQTGQPGPVTADFSPRLVVTAGAGGLSAAVGPRGQGDSRVSADPARLPAGSVMEVKATDGARRVVGVLTPPGDQPPDLSDPDVATPAPLVDTGEQPGGNTVVVVLADPGTLRLSEVGRPDDALEIEITPRSSA